MRSQIGFAPLVVGLASIALGLGCVTQGTFDELSAERDALQQANAELEGANGVLQEENASLVARAMAAEAEKAAAEQTVASLTGTYDQLVGELEQEVESGQIAIRRVLNGISLNVSEELLFASGQAGLSESGKKLLARVAERIQSEPSSVWVEGHTDNVRVGKVLRQRYPTNWELAGARAASVVRVLTENGVAPERLRAVSRGPFAPVTSNDTEEGRAKNRRTEIILRPPSSS